MKKIYKIPLSQKRVILKQSIDYFGLPNINIFLNLYIKIKENIIEISFINNKCFTRFYFTNTVDSNQQLNQFQNFPFFLENRNIRQIFIILKQLKINSVFVRSGTRYDFNDQKANLTFYRNDGRKKNNYDLYTSSDLKLPFLKNYNFNLVESIDIVKKINLKYLQEELIFDSIGNLNLKIKDYCNTFGVNLSQNELPVISLLEQKNNDFSILQNAFYELTNENLISHSHKNISTFKLTPVSIIIPCFNSESSILSVLQAIKFQNLPEEYKKEGIQVILIDDCSNKRVFDLLKESKKTFPFAIDIIRQEKNQGLSTARNLGASSAKNEYLIFIDSDIILSNNYIYEHMIRLMSIPNTIFMSMKKNIDKDSDLLKTKKGFIPPKTFNDKRLFKKHIKDFPWVNKIQCDGDFYLLEETYYFSQFGNGRKVNGHDLPSCVVGHNLSLSKSTFKKIGGFSNKFSGWGLEDTLFGVNAIIKGNFIIPIISTGVYHINHPPRSLSESKKIKEYKNNLKIYQQEIEKTYENF